MRHLFSWLHFFIVGQASIAYLELSALNVKPDEWKIKFRIIMRHTFPLYFLQIPSLTHQIIFKTSRSICYVVIYTQIYLHDLDESAWWAFPDFKFSYVHAEHDF